jgi:hypothetical protein
MSVSFDPTTLTPLDHQLAASWRQAAAELGIAVTAPFELPAVDVVFRYGALVHGFGTAKGVLLRAMTEEPPYEVARGLYDAAREAGFCVATLSPLLCRYDQDEFSTFLNFFAWEGRPASRPPWHVGPDVAYPDLGWR